MSEVLPRIGRASLSEQVAGLLENRILAGDLPAGDLLPPHDELGDQLGVSRSVVRDALRTLQARGLVEVKQGVGTLVSAHGDEAYSDAIMLSLIRSHASVGEVAQARAAIERMIALVAATRRTEDDLERMEGHLDVFEQAVVEEDWLAALDAHGAFHNAILDATHMPVLKTLLGPIKRIVLASSLPPAVDNAEFYKSAPERAILDALRKGDEQEVDLAIRNHFAFIDDPQYTDLFGEQLRDATSAALLVGDSATRHKTIDGTEQPATTAPTTAPEPPSETPDA